jgi:hypothetical protein
LGNWRQTVKADGTGRGGITPQKGRAQMEITFKRKGRRIQTECMEALAEHGIPCKLDNCLRVIAKTEDNLWHVCECWRRSSNSFDEFVVDIDTDKRFAIRG